ncbi:MAG: DNA gyrase inhibitor YacG [Myxococcaceae bacterium]
MSTSPGPGCPVCHKLVAPRAQNPMFPFCSQRCRMVDLGKWLGEEYRVPESGADEREDENPATSGDANEERK